MRMYRCMIRGLKHISSLIIFFFLFVFLATGGQCHPQVSRPPSALWFIFCFCGTKFSGSVPQFPLQWRLWHNKTPVPVPQTSHTNIIKTECSAMPTPCQMNAVLDSSLITLLCPNIDTKPGVYDAIRHKSGFYDAPSTQKGGM